MKATNKGSYEIRGKREEGQRVFATTTDWGPSTLIQLCRERQKIEKKGWEEKEKREGVEK